MATSNSTLSNSVNNVTTKSCAVCGDIAIGTNFGVISCESCKAFFRRNGLRKTTITCPFQGNCLININSRKNCQACRLKKCINVGMKKDFITKNKNSKRYLNGNNNINNRGQKFYKVPCIDFKKRTKWNDKVDNYDIINENDNINLSKDEYESLINKIKNLEDQLYSKEKDECICICKCGFYPMNTKFSTIIKLKEENSQKELPKEVTILSMNKEEYKDSQKCILTEGYLNNNFTPTDPNTIQQSQVGYYNNVMLEDTITMNDYDKRNIINNSNLPFSYFNNNNNTKNIVNNTIPLESKQLKQFSLNSIPSISQDFFPCTLNIDTQVSNIIENEYSKKNDDCFKKTSLYITPPPSNIECSNSIQNMSGYFENWEMELLLELIKSNSIMKEPVNVSQPSNSNDFSLQDIVEFTNLAFRRTIQMSKMLSLFKQLDQNDQMALVKGGASEILILRGAMVYDVSRGGWKHYASKDATDLMIKIDVLKNSPEQSYYLKHKQFLETFNERWRKSEEVMLLLNVLILFNSARLNVQNINGVIAANFVYKHILKKYILYQCYNEEEGQREFDHLMNKLIELEELNKGLVSIYSLLTINEMDPLLIELFDLK
ncbi:Nuclear hormone receptor HR96 [Strongyloides ratti]|uniref:Nuclear hormone receptor HR96 n=1 Tax=Strongyloides ratti TaxID=34506 RepID=A0A090KT74_STRRB|nr:Nuclear hormone receptor HR96 [Strongyloides ratti]CEF60680.1 Nuclear hormone receptor HR96 [Strongyloides ratti]